MGERDRVNGGEHIISYYIILYYILTNCPLPATLSLPLAGLLLISSLLWVYYTLWTCVAVCHTLYATIFSL